MTAAYTTRLHLFTIGHSNRSLEDFLSLLHEFNIRALADIRRFPSSRHFPHFNRNTLHASLAKNGVHYVWLETLGGRRRTGLGEASPNKGLTSPQMRNYADYLLSTEGEQAIEELLILAARTTTAVMCAEKFFWRCHRRLLCDCLVARGVQVFHILGPCECRPHRVSSSAAVTPEGKVTHPLVDLFSPRT